MSKGDKMCIFALDKGHLCFFIYLLCGVTFLSAVVFRKTVTEVTRTRKCDYDVIGVEDNKMRSKIFKPRYAYPTHASTHVHVTPCANTRLSDSTYECKCGCP